MKTVRFLEERTFVREGRPTLKYESGSAHTLKDDHARRWVQRGAAVYVAAAPDAAEAPANPKVTMTREQSDARDVAEVMPHAEVSDAAKEPADVDPVASAPAVAGKDGGSAGERTKHVASSGASRPRGRPPGSGRK